jgi:glyoxylase-like metal-dependent hydrolase (beta-lactamase superfamily II)
MARSPVSFRVRAAAAVAAALPWLVHAQGGQDFSKVEIRTTALAPDFHTLEGQGGTVSVLSGPDGVLVVDSQFAPLTDKLVAAIRGFSDAPIRFLVDTHVHPDHTGGNEHFARLGATILARDQLRERLEKPAANQDGSTRPAQPPAALPVLTYDAPLSLYLDGEHVVLMPVRRAHTDGDTVVIFPGHDIVAVGDIFRSVGYPYVDRAGGGTLAGELEALSEVADRIGPATRVVPGHGPMVHRDALLAQRDLIIALRAKVLALARQGKTLEEVIASKPTAEWDAGVPQGAQTADRFVKWVYEEVAADR